MLRRGGGWLVSVGRRGMAGHSQFQNIMHKKAKEDARMVRMYDKCRRDLRSAIAQGGGVRDPAENALLRQAVDRARALGVPKSQVESVLADKGGSDGAAMERVQYVAKGGRGILLLIEGLTDKRERTVANVRTVLKKHGAELVGAEQARLFEKVGRVSVWVENEEAADAATLVAIDAGASSVEEVAAAEEGEGEGEGEGGGEAARGGGMHVEFSCAAGNLDRLRGALVAAGHDAPLATVVTTAAEAHRVVLDAEAHAKLKGLVEAVEEDADVQAVYHNVVTVVGGG